MSKSVIWGLAFALAVWSGPALAGDLTEKGARLDPIGVDPASVTVERSVALTGDAPVSTHVTALTGAGKRLQRTNEGYWIPWTGRLDELVDNGFASSGDRLRFKVLKDEDMRGELFPVRVMIGYKTADSFKFGIFELRDGGTGAK